MENSMKGKKMKRTILLLTLLVSISLVGMGKAAASGQPMAAVTKTEREYRQTVDGEGALTEQMIEDCVVLKTEIESSYAEITQAKDKFDALNNEVTELGDYLKKNRDMLRGDKEAQATYNKKQDFYNSQLPELNKQQEAYKEMSKPYQELVDKLNRECQGQQYYEDDYARIVEKMGRGM